MDNIYFITDLDRTIIHSKSKGYKCVEMMGDREVTYMTDVAYNKLKDLLRIKKFKFIPCTMRSFKQTMRVDFIREYNPEIIICSNGAQVYINGDLDFEWDNYIKSLYSKENLINDINYLKCQQSKLKEKVNILEIRNIEDFYITIKCLNYLEAKKFYGIIKDSFDKYLNVLLIDAKIFIIHEKINKVYAVDYVVKKFNINRLITAGDSQVDEDFTKRGICILPRHSSFKHQNAIITKKENISSTEDILDIVYDFIKK